MSGVLSGLREDWAAPGWLTSLIEVERRRVGLWLPVFMGVGVLLYFSLRFEPVPWLGAAVVAPALIGVIATRRWPIPRYGLLVIFVAAAGFASAQLATLRAPALVALPRTAVVLTGTVRGIELLPVGRRISLDHAQLGDGAPIDRWVRVRLRKEDASELEVGDRVRVRALVRAPSPPAYPGGWDLQRDAFFSGLAGSGFALGTWNDSRRPRRAGSPRASSGCGPSSARGLQRSCRVPPARSRPRC